MPAHFRRVVVLFVCTAVMAACTRTLPPTLTNDEFQLYSAWLASYVGNREVPQLLVENRTFPVNWLFHDQVPSKECLASSRLLDPLLALGDAQFSLQNNRGFSIVVPFSYRLVDAAPMDSSSGYDTVRYSRAAFNRSHSEAVFAVRIGHCYLAERVGRLVCGGGTQYFVRAHRTGNGNWQFQRLNKCPAWQE